MSFIVSANYRNRDSEYKWLVRHEDEKPEQAVAYKRVECGGVKFEDSNAYETGFGCRLVARCTSVVGHDPEPVTPTGERIRFAHWHFVNAETGDEVTGADSLILREDGAMFANGTKG